MAAVPEPFSLTVRNSYVETFWESAREGTKVPLVFPYSFFASAVVPVLYLSIPHTKRPWLYKARWLVFAFICAFNARLVQRTSSDNIACAYATGLLAWWGIMVSAKWLIFSAPQFEAERIVKVKPGEKVCGVKGSGSAEVGDVGTEKEKASGGMKVGNGHLNVHTNGSVMTNGHAANGTALADKNQAAREPWTVRTHRGEEGYKYYWQAYPENAPFGVRFNWVADLLLTNFRGEGWNHAIPTVPHPARPEKPRSGEPVDVSMPSTTRAGYVIHPDSSSFLKNRFIKLSLTYISLDFLSTLITKDPYFVLGPNSRVLPSFLHGIHPWVRDCCRSLLVLTSIYLAIVWVVTFIDLYQYAVGGYFIPLRRDTWTHSTLFGAPGNVLDRGLAGFWGGTWHQIFRLGFTAPATWLVKQGYLEENSTQAKLAAMAFAFGNSGILHMCGSYTTVPDTKWWRPGLFFAYQAVGIVMQIGFCHLFGAQIGKLPTWARKAGNLLFVLAWLELACWPLADDFATGGVWLFEPVPVSLFRGLGWFGSEGERWWRWDRPHQLQVRCGQHWWECGI